MGFVHELIKEVLIDSQPSALATIVHVEGSAYRREGACIVLKENHSRTGVLSGGCLESDLETRAQEIFNTGKTEMMRYDLSSEDDLGWGLGAGCNGVISVLVRDIDANFRHSLSILNAYLLKKHPVLFIQSMKDLHKYMFLVPSGETFGNEKFPIDFENIIRSTSPFHKFAKQIDFDNETYFVQLVWPKPELYIIGAGEDARPLARLAADTGYAVHMVDWREGLCSKLHFPSATAYHVGKIDKLIETLTFSPLDSVVIMTHDFQRDIEILQRLKEEELFYLGILGSKNRTERLLGGLIPNWIHSPVGLSIGADGPEEIAVSIVAELIAKRMAVRK